MGAVFAIMGGVFHWFPLILGVQMNNKWALSQFILIFLGVNLTFFPQHFIGLAGIPRRYVDYPDTFFSWNILSSFGSLLSIVASLYVFFILWEALISQRQISSNIRTNTLIEWKANLPPASHSYTQLNSFAF
jgi:cytochrome c oxidase subunit 1